MKITLKKKTDWKENSRKIKKARVRKKVFGTEERPRLAVFRSSKHIYAQLVNDTTGKTLFSASSLKVKGDLNGIQTAKEVGVAIAKLAAGKSIKAIVFDRGGYLYHGRVKSLADGAREGGLQF
jgi:large subunit ribosomal protein L18